jgi:hypothetical protein
VGRVDLAKDIVTGQVIGYFYEMQPIAYKSEDRRDSYGNALCHTLIQMKKMK